MLIEGEQITYVGPRLDTTPDAELIDAASAIVIPGLVDGHRHTWEALLRGISVDWTFANYYQGLRVVVRPPLPGRRHVRGKPDRHPRCARRRGHHDPRLVPQHQLPRPRGRGDRSNRDSRARVVFGYGNSNDEWLPVSTVPHSHDAKRIREQLLPRATAGG